MTEENPKEWADKTAQYLRHCQETTFIDHIRGIGYSLIQQHDEDEVRQVLAESFVYGNEIVKHRGITVEEYKEAAVTEYQMALEDQLGFVARDIQSNQVVGVALAYTYASVIKYIQNKDVVAESSEAMAPIMDIMQQLYAKLLKVESFDPDQAVIFEDTARVRDERFAGKGIGYACFKILYAHIYRQGYSILLGISFNPYTQTWASLHSFKKVCCIHLSEYTYRDQKVFSSLAEKGFDSLCLYLKRGQ